MSTISTPFPTSPALCEVPELTTSHAGSGTRIRLQVVAIVLTIATLAIGLRVWNLNATLATSDQAAMAWMLRYKFGVKWIFAHDYGPVVPIVDRTWAALLNRVHMPLNEAATRLPVVFASLLQVLVTFGLVRRLGLTRRIAAFGTLVTSLLPVPVTDAHFCWGYPTFWLLTGTTALWATLSYLDTRRARWLALAGASLAAHCLSNCFAFAMPLTILIAWRTSVRANRASSKTGTSARSTWTAWCLGFALPCLLALAVIGGSWKWTGGGQLGHLLFKHRAGSTGLQIAQLAQVPWLWGMQFGYLFGIVAAAGLVYGTMLRDRCRLLAVLCWTSVLSLLFCVDWSRVGYPTAYAIEAAYAGGLLGAIWVARVWARLASHPSARLAFAGAAGIALLHMGIGSADACLQDGRLASLTGIRTGWGSVKPETGIKAAGWYVRKYVPADAIVMTTHTNTGMEAPVAEYYLGRQVLADCDLRPDMLPSLTRTLQGNLDVLVVDATWVHLADAMVGFERVATFRAENTPVRYVYARESLSLPRVDAKATALNALYDRECQPTRVPQAFTPPPQFHAELKLYQGVVRRLRSTL